MTLTLKNQLFYTIQTSFVFVLKVNTRQHDTLSATVDRHLRWKPSPFLFYCHTLIL